MFGMIRGEVCLVAVVVILVGHVSSVAAQGIWLSVGGPVNRSMGGASAAAPIDAIGAMYWNPATISGLAQSELAVGLDLLYTEHSIASSVGGLSGHTEADNGISPIPTVGWVHHVDHSPVSLGMFMGCVAGFETNLNADATNPLLMPQPQGLGRVSTEAGFVQIAPVLSVALTERLAVAAGPTITLGELGIEPFMLDSANGDGTYPSGRAGRYHWGGGAQAGVYYITDCGWHWGASVKSPVWMERFRFFAEDENGVGRLVFADVDLPMIVSVGTAYSGLPNWVFAADVRYFDYKNTNGFGDPATFSPDGALGGLDFENIVAVAAGVQRRLTERTYVRAGYTFNQSPSSNSEAMINVGSPLFYQHMVSTGVSWELSPAISINLAYSYLFPSQLDGPIITPADGPLPGTSVSNRLEAHAWSFGVTARY